MDAASQSRPKARTHALIPLSKMSEWNDCPICHIGMISETRTDRYHHVICPSRHYEVGWNSKDNVFWEEIHLSYLNKIYELDRYSTTSDDRDVWTLTVTDPFDVHFFQEIYLGSFPAPFGFNGKRLFKLLMIS